MWATYYSVFNTDSLIVVTAYNALVNSAQVARVNIQGVSKSGNGIIRSSGAIACDSSSNF